jgi:flagellar hook protein FlgE
MSSGFSIGLNALQANSAAIEVASKNIAASNVGGFKSTEFLFQEALTRSLQPSASGRFGTVGTSGVSRRNYSTGSAKYSASPLDMSITGDGLFTVGLFKEPSTEKTFFTRSGQFLTDKDGFIVSSSGLFLYGYQPTADGSNINPNKVGPLKEPSSPMDPKKTSAAAVSVNLDSRLPIVPEKIKIGTSPEQDNLLNTDNPATYSHVQQFALFDTVGQQHSVSLYFRRVDKRIYDLYVNVDGQVFGVGDATKIETPLEIKMPAFDDPAQASAEVKAVARFGFFEGKLQKVADTLTENDLVAPEPGIAAGAPENQKLFIKIVPPEAGKQAKNPSLVFSDPITFSLDFGGTTSFAASFEVKKVEQDGFSAGSLTGLSVDDKGVVRGQFTNGKSVISGQLQLATFKGLGGLREVSNNTFQATPQSGDPILARPTEQSLGSIRSNSVEEANTDMAGELVRLMVQQRNYQANAQSIRTQVEILSVTIDVTR